jgi:hypothetical protein
MTQKPARISALAGTGADASREAVASPFLMIV